MTRTEATCENTVEMMTGKQRFMTSLSVSGCTAGRSKARADPGTDRPPASAVEVSAATAAAAMEVAEGDGANADDSPRTATLSALATSYTGVAPEDDAEEAGVAVAAPPVAVSRCSTAC